MQVLIAHSHLNPGGVTRIIESQIESLEGTPVKVLVGACSSPEAITSRGAELVVIEELNYLERKSYSDEEATEILQRILEKLRQHLTPDTVLHFHNLNLGKNPIVTYAVYLLAKEGTAVFNHAHDFAEDRPANYAFLKEILHDNFLQDFKAVLYPQFSNYQFGVLNSFDVERLTRFGIEADRIEWLPNPVTFSASNQSMDKADAKAAICKSLNIDSAKKLITYPVRVIERKNIGEFILLSVLFDHVTNFAVTQPPQNPAEIELYRQWVSFCQVQNIPVIFEAGNKVDFETLLRASDFCISTSYREGFGMVYLEPWLLNTPVVGRDIHYITEDFKADGFQFPTLYYKINIPEVKVDFKELNMKMQMEIISELLHGKISKQQIFELNPILATLFREVSDEMIANNKAVIKNNYSVQGYGRKLQKRYKKLVG